MAGEKEKVGVYLPRKLKQTIDRLCEVRKRNLSNLIEVVFEEEIARAIASGELPETDFDEEESDKEAKRAQLAKDRLIEAIAKGEEPERGDVSIAAHALHLDARSLNAQVRKVVRKKPNGNPTPA